MDKLMSFFAKLGAQRHLVAIRDGFVTLMPLMIIGSLVTLINQVPGIINQMFGTQLALPVFISTLNGNIWWGTFDMIGLMTVVAISYNLARHYDSDSLAAAVVSLSSYLAIVPQIITAVSETGEEVAAWGNVNRAFTNAQGLFVGIIIALIATEIFVSLKKNDKLVIKMPDGVPPAVGRSFAAVVPGGITVIAMTAAVMIIERVFHMMMGGESMMSIFALVTTFVSQPLLHVADSLGYALVVVFFNQFLWFFGLHGSNIIEGIIQPISLQMMEINAVAFQAGQTVPHIVTKPFLDAFVYIGGSGTVLGMLLAIFLVGKAKQHRTIAKLSIGPSCFNINEPTIFGMPIVLNPILFVPFICAPLVVATVSYLSMAWGLVGRTVAIVPWATPPIISGFLVTGGDWRACVLQIINIAISFVIYLPFVKVADRAEMKREKEMEA